MSVYSLVASWRPRGLSVTAHRLIPAGLGKPPPFRSRAKSLIAHRDVQTKSPSLFRKRLGSRSLENELQCPLRVADLLFVKDRIEQAEEICETF